MMPRPILSENFGLKYRKIPVLLIGREMYCDTSIIIEALEYHFEDGHQSLYSKTADGRDYRPLIRGFASYWTDRALFRVTTGLIPPSVWRTTFGADRANLIGHKLDAEKLGAKVSRNKSNLDLQLSMLEPLFSPSNSPPWLLSTPRPSLADLSLYYQLTWGIDMVAGRGIENLTGGGTSDTDVGSLEFFNARRYPGVTRWFGHFRDYVESIPSTETVVSDEEAILEQVMACQVDVPTLLPTATPQLADLDDANGLNVGVIVSVAPDDTGRSSPTIGTLVAISTEEVVIMAEERPKIEVNIHFPRLGFEVRAIGKPRL